MNVEFKTDQFRSIKEKTTEERERGRERGGWRKEVKLTLSDV